MPHKLDDTVQNFDVILQKALYASPEALLHETLIFLADISEAASGVFYVLHESDEFFEALTGFAVNRSRVLGKHIKPREGLVGQVAFSGKELYLNNLDPKRNTLDIASVELRAKSLYILPLNFNNKTLGVIQLISLKNISLKARKTIRRLAANLASTLNSIYHHIRNKQLLQETRFQKEELRSREEEIRRNLNELISIQELLEDQKDRIQEAFHELEERNVRILSSIRYAERIQQAILPRREKFDDFFKEHFVLFRPKDVVSGDFYWSAKVKDLTFVGVIDCTGHGVPGAFMSMIGHALLNQIVIENGLTDPAKIITTLDQEVRKALQQNNKDGANNDGMDLSICAVKEVDSRVTEVRACVAKSYFYYTNHGKVYRLKGDRRSVGGALRRNKKAPFTTHKLRLRRGDILYLTTDGIIDIYDTKRRRYGSGRLYKFLKENIYRPLEEQSTILRYEVRNFQDITGDQRDDITFIALKL